MSPESFERIQRRFFSLVSAREGVASAVGRAAAVDPGASPLERWIQSPLSGSALERLDIYAQMYSLRMRDALRENYPMLGAFLGDELFFDVAAEYVQAHPSDTSSLRWFGRRLAEWLAIQPIARRFPFLPDLARLEWARSEAFDAENATPLAEEALAHVPPEAWAGLRLRVVPSVRRLQLRYAVHDLWRSLDLEQPASDITEEPTEMLIFRQDFRVYHRALPIEEAVTLDALAEGASFGEACERLCERCGEEKTTSLVLDMVVSWVQDGLLGPLDG